MAVTVSLLGTHFYGQRDFHRDGSYLTTEWRTVLYLPLVPIGSCRAVPNWPAHRRELLAPVASSLDDDCDFLPCTRSARQVLCVYGFVMLMAIWLFFLFRFVAPGILGWLDFLIGIPLLILLALLPLPLPWFLRYAARQKMRGR